MAWGVWLGFIVAYLLNNLIVYKISSGHPMITLWILIFIFSPLFGYASFVNWQFLLILSTGFIGAYGFIISIAIIFGESPD
jgi:hypothetical protein